MSFDESILYVGTQIRLKAEWHKPVDPNDEPAIDDPLADPTEVTLEIRLPDGTVVDHTADIVRDSVGKYHALYTITLPRKHEAIWRGTGNAQQVVRVDFYAREI